MSTPCPLRRSVDCREQTTRCARSAQHFLAVNQDDNTTTVVSKALRDMPSLTQPTVHHSLARKPKRNIPITICEDDTAQGLSQQTFGPHQHKSTTISAKPAKKSPLSTSTKDASRITARSINQQSLENRHVQTTEMFASMTDKTNKHCADPGDGRRRTIWMPSDDTTILTIHPGARARDMTDDTVQLANALRGITVTAQKSLPARNDRSSLSLAPKRIPLIESKHSQPNLTPGDIAGAPNGKENVPPGAYTSGKGISSKGISTAVQTKSTARQHGPAYVRGQVITESRFCQPATRPQARHSPPTQSRPQDYLHKPRTRPLIVQVRGVSSEQSLISTTRICPKGGSLRATKKDSSHGSNEYVPKALNVPQCVAPLQKPASLLHYPILSEDLQHPELVEDGWLDHQETSLTQLVNGLFQQAHGTHTAKIASASLRSKLLQIYQQDHNVELHKRLSASLDYGALALPKTMNPPNTRGDIGLRRQFLDFWLMTYQHDALRACAEVVVGRQSQQPFPHEHGTSSGNAYQTQTGAKSLENFLLTFLVRNDDMSGSHMATPASARSPDVLLWQKTVLRSFMLIHLLDTAKTQNAFNGCLFRHNSSSKTSGDVLRACAKILCPSTGDVTRPLGHMAYRVVHVQHPLQECTYHIDNLAVDLRDGVLLTRLVELLLYPPAVLDAIPDRTISVTLPSGDLVTSSWDTTDIEAAWVLSRHLKVPCVSRVQKLANVSIALAALFGVVGPTETAISNVKAEDIVDGHREKTLSLLWALVSRWGLHYLLDKDELQAEIRRCAADDLLLDLEDIDEAIESSQIVDLLKLWSRSICTAKQIPIDNLTTSFADGRALETIVDAYANYIPNVSMPRSSDSVRVNLHSKLKAIGCSQAFIAPILATTSHVPSRSTTISTLAFLASRLIPLSRSHRAVSTIQRAWRLYLSRRTVGKRVTLARLAADCAVVVLTREKILDSAVVLQRAWRRVLDARIQRLVGDVVAFQMVARAWALRKALSGSLPGAMGGKRRVMGGW